MLTALAVLAYAILALMLLGRYDRRWCRRRDLEWEKEMASLTESE